MINKLVTFKKASKLRIALLNILAKQVHSEKYSELDDQFKVFDLDNSGVIDKKEIKMVL